MSTAATRDESKRVNDMRGTRIIISASGMITGGRVLHHAMRVLPNENATVIFVGYNAAGTVGRRIQDGEPEVRIHGRMVPVRARVEQIDNLSAHADYREILRWEGKLHWDGDDDAAPVLTTGDTGRQRALPAQEPTPKKARHARR